MSETARRLLERALAAEDRAEAMEHEVADIRSRLKGAIGADPTTAVAALSWVYRCDRAEALLGEIVRYLDQRSLTSTDLPDGWEARARAQMKAAEIAQRDQEGFSRPDDTDYWTQSYEKTGRQTVISERRDR